MTEQTSSAATIQSKDCPYCGEPVRAEAKKCKHCGETLDVSLRAVEDMKRQNAQGHGPMVFMNAGGGGGGATASSSSAAAASSSGSSGGYGAMKSKGVAYFLLIGGSCLFLCGLHRFYLGKVGTGLLWLFTFGLLGIGQLIDLFTLGQQVDVYNSQQRR